MAVENVKLSLEMLLTNGSGL